MIKILIEKDTDLISELKNALTSSIVGKLSSFLNFYNLKKSETQKTRKPFENTCVDIFTYMCVFVYIYLCIYIYVCICIYINVCIYICKYMYIYMYIYVYMYFMYIYMYI